MLVTEKKFIKPEPKWETFIIGIKCDCCEELFKGTSQEYGGSVNYKEDCYEINKTCISKEDGHHYPEGGHSSLTAWHICQNALGSMWNHSWHQYVKPNQKKRIVSYDRTR